MWKSAPCAGNWNSSCKISNRDGSGYVSPGEKASAYTLAASANSQRKSKSNILCAAFVFQMRKRGKKCLQK